MKYLLAVNRKDIFTSELDNYNPNISRIIVADPETLLTCQPILTDSLYLREDLLILESKVTIVNSGSVLLTKVDDNSFSIGVDTVLYTDVKDDKIDLEPTIVSITAASVKDLYPDTTIEEIEYDLSQRLNRANFGLINIRDNTFNSSRLVISFIKGIDNGGLTISEKLGTWITIEDLINKHKQKTINLDPWSETILSIITS